MTSETRSAGVSAVPDKCDVLVIGAGIVGAACALELAQAGKSVTVLERGVVGGGATAAGMGHIVVLNDSPAQLSLTRYSQQLWDALALEDPAPHEFNRCGSIWIAADDAEMAEAHRKQQLYSAHGVPAQLLDADALYACEPNLRPGLAGGLLAPDDSVVYAPRSAALLLQRAVNLGARMRWGTARRLLHGGLVLADGSVIECDAVVLANGVHAAELAPELPLRAKKGHLAITDRYPGLVQHQLVELGYVSSAHAASGESVAFNVQPRATGQLLVGSSRQFDAPNGAVDQQTLARMLRRALEYLPMLAALSCIRAWTGTRAATPDGLPLIGPDPQRPGVWLATGHEGLGITTALATARLLAAQLLGRTPEIAAEAYLPGRSFGEH